MKDLLLEIGVENVPAFYVAPAVEQLREGARELLDAARLPRGEIETYGAPRRLVLRVRNLAERQDAAEELVTGPPTAKAFDAAGHPTRAAEGFARSQGVAVGRLERVDTPKGEYLAVRRRLERARTTTILRERLPALVASLHFPKSMRWESSGTRFARPVRWIACLFGTTVVRFRFADVTSGNVTRGRPWMPRERATVRSAGAYDGVMRRLGVVIDARRRRERIHALAEGAASRLGLRVVEDEDLLTELTYMVEDPRVLVGEFDPVYLELPPEVVTTAMRSHQRYLALVDRKGRLVARFVTFTDGRVGSPAEVRRGNERVLRARLEDARFYWGEDVERGVDGLADELDRIVFLEGLGTVGEKWRRVEQLALWVNERLDPSGRADAGVVQRASKLAKADLASEMIKDGKEFTKLQGLIGSHYARAAGEPAAVVEAVREHYQPRTPADPVPASPAARVVGVADRADTIAGCFLAGLVPTGSQDPYALRRLANGLIRLLRDEPGVGIDDLVDAALALYRASERAGDEAVAAARAALAEFFRSRCEAFLRDSGIPYDVADAVTPVAWARPGRALDLARAMATLRGDRLFERLITGVKRVGNILAVENRRLGLSWEAIRAALDGRGPQHPFEAGRFEEPAEGALLATLRHAVPGIEAAEGRGDAHGVLEGLSGLADPIDRYFDAVLVNCDDPTLRQNRHAFLAAAYAVFGRVADFSAIVEEPTAKP